jgi:fatty acid-binding protein DegV
MRFLLGLRESLASQDHDKTAQSQSQPQIDPTKIDELEELLLEISLEDLDAIEALSQSMKRSGNYDIDLLIREARQRADAL